MRDFPDLWSLEFPGDKSCFEMGASSFFNPLFLVIGAILAGGPGLSAAFANDGTAPCEATLAKPAADAPAMAVAAAWKESVVLALTADSNRSEEIIARLLELRRSEPAYRDGFDIANTMDFGAVIEESLGALSEIAESLVAAGVLDESVLQAAFLREFDALLVSFGAVTAVRAETETVRSEINVAVSRVSANGRVMVSPLELPDGNVLVLGFGGSIDLVTQRGKSITSGRLGRDLSHAPIVLEGGRVLVYSAVGKAWILDRAGRVQEHLDVPQSAGGKGAFQLADGGVLFVGGGGDLLILNSDGSLRARRELHASFSSRPVQAPDGTVYLLAAALSTVFRMSPNGDLLGHHRIFDHLVLTGSPLLLPDGSWLVVDHRGTIHFLKPDWTPRMRWWFFSPITFKPLGGATGSMRLLDDGNILVRGWKDQLAIFNSSGRMVWSLDDALISHSLPIEVEPGVFLVLSASRGYVLCGPGMSGFRKAAVELSSPGVVPPVRLSDGTMAISHPHNHLMQVIDPVGDERFRFKFKGSITAPPVLLSNGAYAVPVDGAGVVIVDPKLLAEEEGAQ